MKTLFLVILATMLSGCIYFNERGVSARYYNDCKEYYDAAGVYHKKCDENIIDYPDANTFKKLAPKKQEPAPKPSRDQW